MILPIRTLPFALIAALALSAAAIEALPPQDPPQDTAAVDSLAADTLLADTVPADTVRGEPEALSDERSDTDETIRSSLQAIFDRVEALADVRVTVEAGIVRMAGTVAELSASERAAALAEAQEGVLWVENDIQLSTSLEKRLEPTWERLGDLAYGTVAQLPLLAVALGILVVFVLLGVLLGRWKGPRFLRSRNPFLQNIVGRAMQVVVVLAGILVALDLLGATALVGAVVGTAGLAGLAISFAFQDIAQNYLAGTLLAIRNPFDQNDHVQVEGFEGKVVRLTPRETILMTLDGNHARIPNALVFRSPLLNFTRNPRRRFDFDVGVGPEDDLALARETGIATLREMAGVLDDPPPEALVVALGDSWVTVRFLGWVDQRSADFGRVKSEAIRLVKLRLEAAGVSLPSPEYLVRMTASGGAVPAMSTTVPSEARPAPVPGAAPGELTEIQADVSVDDAVDRQIAEDRRDSGEENLLGTSGG